MEFVNLISSAGEFAWIVACFVVALSIIVAVHEYGHYIVGRWSGIDADVFSIGFGPVLWSRYDTRGTRWQIAALPFGGYVKFAGDADAASAGRDDAAMAEMDAEKLRRTMHGAPIWARASTVVAGPVFNFILSILIFAGVALFTGGEKDPLTVERMNPLPVEAGDLRPGDVIRGIGGLTLPERGDETYPDIIAEIPEEPVLAYDIERDGQRMAVEGPYLYPPLVGRIIPQSAARLAGFEEGDVITALDGEKVFAFGQLKRAVEGSDGRSLNIEVWRNGDTVNLTLSPKRVDDIQADGSVETYWRIGIGGSRAFEAANESVTVTEALTAGAARTWLTIDLTIKSLGNIVLGKMDSCNLTGPVRIAKTAGDVAQMGLMEFVLLIGMLSTAIGFFNLLPIPVLDGGHLVFHTYEAIVGQPPSDRAMQAFMVTGLALVLSLMVFALSNDFFCP